VGRTRASLWGLCLLGVVAAGLAAWIGNWMGNRGGEDLDGATVQSPEERARGGPALQGLGDASAPSRPGGLPEVTRASVFGRVLSTDGSPIADASVWSVANPDARDADALRSDVPRTTTDAGGLFRLGNDRLSIELAASAPGFVGRAFGPFRSGGLLTLVLARATGRVLGVVRDAKGHPLAGASVLAGEWWKAGAVTTTDAEGSYALPRAWAGLVDVAAYATGFQAAFGRAPAAGPDSDSRLDLVLKPGRRVRGRVVDAATGRGIGGANLDAQDAPGAPVRSGPDGAFEVFLAPDDTALEARAPGYARGWAEFERGPRAVENVVVELRPFASSIPATSWPRGCSEGTRTTWTWCCSVGSLAGASDCGSSASRSRRARS
jgi:hypothetical protein